MAAASIDCRATLVARNFRRVRKLLRRRSFAAALASTRSILQHSAQDPQALFLLAVAQRGVGELAEGLATLERLETLQPQSGRLFQERGRCLRALDNPLAAFRAFQRAVSLNPALCASWRAVAAFHEARGHPRRAALAQRCLCALKRLPPPLRLAAVRLAEGDIASGERILHRFLQSEPQHPEALVLLGRVSVRQEALADAEFLLKKALTVAPHHTAARFEYALVLARLGQHAQALAATRSLLALESTRHNDHAVCDGTGLALGQADEALRTYRSLVREDPGVPELHLAIGHALTATAHHVQAAEAYRTATLSRPSFGEAYWSLAACRRYRFSREEVTRMWAEEAAADIAPVDRYHLCFALGRALEARAEYELAFRYYSRGNRLKRATQRYDPRMPERSLHKLAQRYPRQLFTTDASAGCPVSGPIFIVGLPHAGAGLIEQMLASHSQVDTIGARPDIERLAQCLSARAAGLMLGKVPPAELERLGEQYLAGVSAHRTGRMYCTDSTLGNFRHLGLIRLILPRAKVIAVRREPMACCFENFRHLFAAGGEFSYSLQDIGRYYRAYTALMRHWDEVLPGWVLHVQYEDLIERPQTTGRRILEFIGLPPEPACLTWRAAGQVASAGTRRCSRAPITGAEIGTWQHFEPWLGELKRVLGESRVL